MCQPPFCVAGAGVRDYLWPVVITCISGDDVIVLQVKDEEDFVSQSAFDELEDKLKDK